MRRSARVQALETIKRRKLTKQRSGESHVTITTTTNLSDHVTDPQEQAADDKAPVVVGQKNGKGYHVINGDSHVNTKTVNDHMTPPLGGHTLFRTTRSQAKLLSQQTVISQRVKSGHVTEEEDTASNSTHVTDQLGQFRYSQEVVKVKAEEPDLGQALFESPDLSREVKPEPVESHDIKPEPLESRDVKLESSAYFPPDIEECHDFSKPEEFDISSNPSVLSQPGPRDWGTIYARVKEMRSHVNAPVDTMGCERLVQDGVPAKVQRFQLLISLMLSSQTKDEVTCQAVLNLREFLKSRDLLLSVEGILSMSVSEIDSCISKVGFHNRKADYISRATRVLVSEFGSDIPPTIPGMTSLPGVGPKMAHLLMHRGWGVNEGIGVDVHVHRLANMWGWVKSKSPEESRVQLEKWLPRELWVDINPTLVGFGQTVCPSKGKKCGVCILDKGLCKARQVKGMEWKEEKWMKEGYEGVVLEYEETEKKQD